MLADDHEVFVEGLRSLIEACPDLEVVAMARDGRELLAALPKARPDLVVTDLSMPEMNGFEAIRRIASEHPATKILCLSMHSEPHFIEESLAAGAAGYVLKDRAFEEVIRAMREVLRGQVFICSQVAKVVVDLWRTTRRSRSESAFQRLSDREREVLQLLAEGQSTREIAERLCISVKTVGTHRQHIMEKTGLSSVAELTKYAVVEGLTDLERRRAPAPKDA